MKIKYTLKDFDAGQIIDKYGVDKNGDAQLWFANNCFRRMQKYVPFRTGALSTTATIKSGSVTYEQPYAHRQYTTNKGRGLRGKYWDQRMISAERSNLGKETEEYMKRKKGNK